MCVTCVYHRLGTGKQHGWQSACCSSKTLACLNVDDVGDDDDGDDNDDDDDGA